MIDAGACVAAKNEDEQTPLHLAAISGHVKVLKEILKRQPESIQDDDENANTATHLAAMNGHVECIKQLVTGGANIGARLNTINIYRYLYHRRLLYERYNQMHSNNWNTAHVNLGQYNFNASEGSYTI